MTATRTPRAISLVSDVRRRARPGMEAPTLKSGRHHEPCRRLPRGGGGWVRGARKFALVRAGGRSRPGPRGSSAAFGVQCLGSFTGLKLSPCRARTSQEGGGEPADLRCGVSRAGEDGASQGRGAVGSGAALLRAPLNRHLRVDNFGRRPRPYAASHRMTPSVKPVPPSPIASGSTHPAKCRDRISLTDGITPIYDKLMPVDVLGLIGCEEQRRVRD